MTTLESHMSVEDHFSQHSLYLDNITCYGKNWVGKKVVMEDIFKISRQILKRITIRAQDSTIKHSSGGQPGGWQHGQNRPTPGPTVATEHV